MIKPRRMRWTGHVTRIWDKRNACRIFVVKPEENSKRKIVYNIKIYLR
jgi:hypothetical protein